MSAALMPLAQAAHLFLINVAIQPEEGDQLG
jgi:hypothetical protein